MNIITSANNAITSVNNKIICRNLPGELNNLCKQEDIPKPLKYIIITLYDYLTLPMYYYQGYTPLGGTCQGDVNEYIKGSTPSIIYSEHGPKLEELKNSLKNKIIDFFKGLDNKEIENHVKNIIEAEEKTTIELKKNRYSIPIFCQSSAGRSEYKKEPKRLGTKYVEVWKFDDQKGIKKVLGEWDVEWFKLNGKRQFIKEIFEDNGMPTTAKEIFKNIINEKKNKDIPKILEAANKFRDEDQQFKLKDKDKDLLEWIKSQDEVLIEWIKDQLDFYTPPEVVSRIKDGWYDSHAKYLKKHPKTNNYSAQYNLKF